MKKIKESIKKIEGRICGLAVKKKDGFTLSGEQMLWVGIAVVLAFIFRDQLKTFVTSFITKVVTEANTLF